MLALARALAGQPHVLVIDELSLGLAPMIREELLDVLRVLADSGTGVLVVEQSARAVLARADLAYVLRRGEIIDHRPAAEWAGREDELAELYVT
jgi:branched-chain amino acid transport system ATP-binding protein